MVDIVEITTGIQGPAGTTGQTGPKGDPGGFVTSTAFASTSDLNTLTTPGLYYMGSGSTAALNAPIDGYAGHIRVQSSGSNIIQEAWPLSTASGSTAAFANKAWVRTRLTGVWHPWQQVHLTGNIGGGDIVGNGSPLGVVSAPVGSYYTDLAITNGASRWFKSSGTSTSGWTVVHGDTGRRAITTWDAAGVITGETLNASWVPAAGLAGGIYARRTTQHVHIEIRNLQRVSTTDNIVWTTYTLPVGFHVPVACVFPLIVNSTSIQGFMINTNGALNRASGAAAGANGLAFGNESVVMIALAQTQGSEAWPSSLPGVAA